MKRWIDSLLNWMGHNETHALEEYLSQSANVADLERRMREWELKHKDGFYLP
jgi:hypothetical protein